MKNYWLGEYYKDSIRPTIRPTICPTIRDHSTVTWRDKAMECLDCEAVLQLGIDALRWLDRADLHIRKVIETGQVEFDEQVDTVIKDLYEAWLAPCEMVNQWIDVQIARSFTLNNLDEFRECESEVRAVVVALKNDVPGSLSNADLAKIANSHQPPADWLEGEEDLYS